MEPLAAILSFAGLSVGWALFQDWLRRQDPELPGLDRPCSGARCGTCTKNSCRRDPRATLEAMRPTELQQRLEAEVMEIEIEALMPHVHRDAAIWVDPELPLVQAALAVSLDATDDVKAWMSEGLLAKVSAPWAASRPSDEWFRFVIVQPFVLIQPASRNED